MKSFKTGRDPDWNDVIRDSMKKPSERLRGHKPPKRLRHQAKKHQTSPPSQDAPPATPPIRPTRPTETQPAPAVPSAPAPPKPSEHVPTPTPTSRTDPPHRPWRASAIALLALFAVAAYVGKRRRTTFLATRSLLSRMRRGSRPKTETTSTSTAGGTSPDETRITSLLTKGASLTGPEAEDAARYLAIEILNGRQRDLAELVLSRSDAWRLFGMDIGTLQEDQIPGLILTDDPQHTRALLARPSSSRRVHFVYDTEAEDLPDSRDQMAVIRISKRTEGTVQAPANGAAASTTGSSVPARLPLLTRPDAFHLLMAMPTRARRDDE